MPVEHFSVEEYFSGYLVNWDAVRRYQSYREPRWRTWLRKMKSWLTNEHKKLQLNAKTRKKSGKSTDELKKQV
jgi:hypothetical protein